jgi:hypothetical protein
VDRWDKVVVEGYEAFNKQWQQRVILRYFEIEHNGELDYPKFTEL